MNAAAVVIHIEIWCICCQLLQVSYDFDAFVFLCDTEGIQPINTSAPTFPTVSFWETFGAGWDELVQKSGLLKYKRNVIFIVTGYAVPRSAISAIWRSQASKSAFFRGNARSQTGKIVLSIGTQGPGPQYSRLTSWQECEGYYCCWIFPMNYQSEFGQDNGLISNTGGPLQNWKGPTYFYRGPRDFYHSTTLTLHFITPAW